MLNDLAAGVALRPASMGFRYRRDALAAGEQRIADLIDQLLIDDALRIARVELADLVLLDTSRPADGGISFFCSTRRIDSRT